MNPLRKLIIILPLLFLQICFYFVFFVHKPNGTLQMKIEKEASSPGVHKLQFTEKKNPIYKQVANTVDI